MAIEPLIINREEPTSPDAARLVEALDADLIQRYGPHEVHGFRPGDAEDPTLVFLIAWMGREAVACGALRRLEAGVGEIKRMFVRPEWRGEGIARRMLSSLEAYALEHGDVAVRLETGVKQPEAIRLYESAGYHRIPAFGDYIDSPLSVCFEKQLAG